MESRRQRAELGGKRRTVAETRKSGLDQRDQNSEIQRPKVDKRSEKEAEVCRDR
jgi:hypothetical protein